MLSKCFFFLEKINTLILCHYYNNNFSFAFPLLLQRQKAKAKE
jgi:hypothetical protein